MADHLPALTDHNIQMISITDDEGKISQVLLYNLGELNTAGRGGFDAEGRGGDTSKVIKQRKIQALEPAFVMDGDRLRALPLIATPPDTKNVVIESAIPDGVKIVIENTSGRKREVVLKKGNAYPGKGWTDEEIKANQDDGNNGNKGRFEGGFIFLMRVKYVALLLENEQKHKSLIAK